MNAPTPIVASAPAPTPTPASAPSNQSDSVGHSYVLTTPSNGKPTFVRRVLTVFQFVIALVVTCAFLAWLLLAKGPAEPEREKRINPNDVVRVAGPALLTVQPESPLGKKMETVTISPVKVSTPTLVVTGRVAASLRPGDAKKGADKSDFWQFDSPEVLSAFTDWQKGVADIAFSQKQLASIKELDKQRVESQKKVVDRLRKLVDIGDASLKELAAEETNLKQFEITGAKEVHEAETQVRIAQRAEAALARQLQQAGLEPDLLQAMSRNVDIVMADVPEGKVNLAKVGQACQARFFGLGDKIFAGKVNRISPTLSKERRSLRVLFAINDPNDELRPGLFAEIGLGTDARETILVPTDAVLHVARSDYVLVALNGDQWRVTEVHVGEMYDQNQVEILGGLKSGDRVLAKAAIVLKPQVVLSLRPQGTTAAAAATPTATATTPTSNGGR
jgi:hypothetical protein